MSPLLEYYETPRAFTQMGYRSLLKGLSGSLQAPLPTQRGLSVCEPCVGAGAIPGALPNLRWITNDLDPRWPADSHMDAASPAYWQQLPSPPAFVWTNPPFTQASAILNEALNHASHGVALHVRISFNEVTKDDPRGRLLRDCPPTGICFLPRFAFRRSPKSGKWTTDSVPTCWMFWLSPEHYPDVTPWIHYADAQTLVDLEQHTPSYRARMDEITNHR